MLAHQEKGLFGLNAKDESGGAEIAPRLSGAFGIANPQVSCFDGREDF